MRTPVPVYPYRALVSGPHNVKLRCALQAPLLLKVLLAEDLSLLPTVIFDQVLELI